MIDPADVFRPSYTDLLPESARTRSGIEYTPSARKWAFRDGKDQISINFNLVPRFAESLMFGLILTLMWYLEHRSSSTARNAFNKFTVLLRWIAERRDARFVQITSEDILAYNKATNRSAYDLAWLQSFLKRWISLGAPGVGKDVAAMLDQMTLTRNPVGVAVATLDPLKGPLTDLEFEAIQCALADAYAAGRIDDEFLLLARLFLAMGPRPAQLASMKLCDLIAPRHPEDGDNYVLMVPRVKQPEQLSRDEFKSRVLVREIGEPLHRYVKTVYARFISRLPDPWQAPLFPQKLQLKYANARGFEYHQTAKALSAKITYAFAQFRVPSERLTGPIPVTPIRFRRTYATRAAEEGLPVFVIAEMLDHSTVRHVQVYAGLTPRIRARLTRGVAMHMAPLAQAFSGRIIQSETGATRPDASSRIIDLRVDQSGAGMGSCGTHAHCGFAKPIACYTCNSFEPWLDGPHESMLDFLLKRRDYLKRTTDLRIASINDRSILGCAQVILRCREIKKGDPRHG